MRFALVVVLILFTSCEVRPKKGDLIFVGDECTFVASVDGDHATVRRCTETEKLHAKP